MAQFVKHTSCPQCGSRNNLGVYDDESKFCFGCHYFVPPSFLSKIHESRHSEQAGAHRPLPNDCNTHFNPVAVSWLTQYGLPISEYIKRGVVFSPSRNQIIFRWFGEKDQLVLWQARNLDKEYIDKDGNKKLLPKYFTSGDHTNILPIYSCCDNVRSSRLVLVEDATSAIKIAASHAPAACHASARPLNGPGSDAMPLLGTHLATQKINALRGYKQVYVWLDHDKGKEALKLANKLCLAGFEAKPIFTENDPKENTFEQIEALCR